MDGISSDTFIHNGPAPRRLRLRGMEGGGGGLSNTSWGGASFLSVLGYHGMDSLLRTEYLVGSNSGTDVFVNPVFLVTGFRYV